MHIYICCITARTSSLLKSRNNGCFSIYINQPHCYNHPLTMKISLRYKMLATVSHIMKSLKEIDGTLSLDKYTLSFTLEAGVRVL